MRREADAGVILRRLLERHERRTGDRRIIERPAQTFDGPEHMRTVTESLREAEEGGAVELIWDRDAPHLVEKVVLVDPDRLYVFTGRQRPDAILSASMSQLDGLEVATVTARRLVSDLRLAWGAGDRVAGIAPADVGDAAALIMAVEAAFTDIGPDVPLRTRSARLLGDSKALERALPAVLAYLRQAGIVDPQLGREDALTALGLVKYPQPVLAAGALSFAGVDTSVWSYVGVPPDLVATVRVTAPVRTVLTIENLESFNRHVRSHRQQGDLVVYTGGFPSNAVLTLLVSLTAVAKRGIHHWGDVDPGGIRIGRHLETALGVAVTPHLMDIDLARRRGTLADHSQLAPKVPKVSAFFDLAEYLRMPEARWLEQEVVDPQVVREI